MRTNAERQEGTIFEALPGLKFKVKLGNDGPVILAHPAGRLKLHHIRMVPGDRVLMELSPDGLLARIVRRL